MQSKRPYNNNLQNKNNRSRSQGKSFAQKRTIPETSRQALKIIPLGGLDGVGKNMYIFEQENDILIVDMGLQMPGANQPGIDYIIPNTQYLMDNSSKIKGVVLTSPHPDHIGAVPYLLHLFPNLHIYATEALFAILESRQDFYSQGVKYKKHIIKPYNSIRVGSFKVNVFPTPFNVMGSIGLCVYTMQGKVFYLSSYKLDSESTEKNEFLDYIKELAGADTFALLSGSSATESQGFAPTEASIAEHIDSVIARKTGAVFVSTFPSMIGRMQQIVNAIEAHNKHLFIEGKSLLNTFNTCRKKGLIQIKSGTIVGPSLLGDTPREQLVVLISGSHGDDIPHLMRLANNEHSVFSIKEGDIVMYPGALIPGNARSAARVNDNFAKLGAFVEYYQPLDTRFGAYGRHEDSLAVLKAIRPKYYVPISGSHHLLRSNGDIAIEGGYPDRNVVVGMNGKVILFDYKQRRITPEKVPTSNVIVDGLGVGDLTNVVIHDRQTMSEEGIFHIVALLNADTREISGDIVVVSKGFVDNESSDKLFNEVKEQTRLIVLALLKQSDEVNIAYIQDQVRENIGRLLLTKTERRPMILPIIMNI
jgi:ribonuclease J